VSDPCCSDSAFAVLFVRFAGFAAEPRLPHERARGAIEVSLTHQPHQPICGLLPQECTNAMPGRVNPTVLQGVFADDAGTCCCHCCRGAFQLGDSPLSMLRMQLRQASSGDKTLRQAVLLGDGAGGIGEWASPSCRAIRLH
jgi:hypothetical protein